MSAIDQARKAVREGDAETRENLIHADAELVHPRTEDNRRTLLHTLADFPGYTPRQGVDRGRGRCERPDTARESETQS